jgi:UDP-glucose 4-epimerase
MTTNVDGTVNVLEAIRSAGGRPLVFASSSSVYGAAEVLPKTIDLAPAPLSPYAVSKLAGESAVLAWRHCYGFPAVPFRFFNVYGPRQRAGDAYAAAIPAFLDAALADRPIPVNGDGMQSRDFTYVGDVTDVLAEVALGGLDSARPVNLAGRRRGAADVIAEMENPAELQPGGGVRAETAPATYPTARPTPAVWRRWGPEAVDLAEAGR